MQEKGPDNTSYEASYEVTYEVTYEVSCVGPRSTKINGAGSRAGHTVQDWLSVWNI